VEPCIDQPGQCDGDHPRPHDGERHDLDASRQRERDRRYTEPRPLASHIPSLVRRTLTGSLERFPASEQRNQPEVQLVGVEPYPARLLDGLGVDGEQQCREYGGPWAAHRPRNRTEQKQIEHAEEGTGQPCGELLILDARREHTDQSRDIEPAAVLDAGGKPRALAALQ